MRIPYKISIKPQSYLLCSNAETTSTLDSQFVFDQNGFPYFPGKTFKGLLKESMIEVLEMMGKPEKEVVETICHFFGVEGDHYNHGKLEISNFHLEGYDDQAPYFKSKDKLTKYQVQQYYLTRVQQTAIDPDTEIAKDTSLRTYGVLNHGRASTFVATMTLDLSEGHLMLLKHALLNLRRAGTRRNRGFGQIKCNIDPDNTPQLDDTPQTDNNIRQENPTWTAGHNALSVKITLREPIVLGTQNTDTNTVFSQDYVSGSQVLGMLAWDWKDKASADFKALFLDNQLVFSPCYPNGAQPLPASIHREKYAAEVVIHNILEAKPDTVTKGIGGLVKQNVGKVQVEKHFNFHASRPNRSAGRSMKDREEDTENKVQKSSGGIFYYEALAKGTVFEGEITGDVACLEKLYGVFGGKNAFRLGKSKSSQYGNVEVVIEPTAKETPNVEAGNYYMVAQSPLIVYNEVGYPSPTKSELERAFGKKITIEKATARIVPIEQYNSVWLAKTGKVMAFEEGSTFKVKVSAPLPKEMIIGEWTHKGFGKVKFLTKEEMEQYQEFLKKEDEATSPNDPAKPKIVADISKSIEEEESVQSIQSKAYNEAQNYVKKKLSNSLLSRMQAVMNLSKAEIKDFFNESTQNGRKPLKEKPAGKALIDAHLYEDLKKIDKLDDNQSLAEYKLYWTAFFDYLRKANHR